MRLWFDDSLKKIYANFGSNTEHDTPVFYVGDRVTVELFRVRAAPGQAIHENIAFPDNAIIRLALGRLTEAPESGTWKIAGGSDLSATATAAAVQTAINNDLGASTVTVTGDNGGPYTVTWAANGAQDLLEFEDVALWPASAAHVRRVRAGTASVPEIQRITLRQTAVAFQETWTDITPTSQVETATAVGTITATGNATVTITSSLIADSPLAISVAVTNADNASTWAGKVRTALNATPSVTAHYTVGGSGATITLTALVAAENDDSLNIGLANDTCTGISAAPTSTNTTAGSPYIGKAGIFSTKTQEAEAVFTTSNGEGMAFELEFEDEDEDVTTAFQVDATLKPGLINPTGNFPTASEGATIGDNGWSPVLAFEEYTTQVIGSMPLNLSIGYDFPEQVISAENLEEYGIFDGMTVVHIEIPTGTTIGSFTDGNTVATLSNSASGEVTGTVAFIGTGGLKRAAKVVDWVGGDGVKPDINRYVGVAGLVDSIFDAVNIRGTQGATGPSGANGADGVDGINAQMTRQSTTSRTIGTGSVSFTFTATASNLGWLVGTRLRAVSAANAANFMEGAATAVSTTAVTISVDVTGGSGTLADWNLVISGGGGVQPIALGGTGATTATAAFDAIKQTATTSSSGAVELATDAETNNPTLGTALLTTLAQLTRLLARRRNLMFSGGLWAGTAGTNNVKGDLLQQVPGATTSAYSLRAILDPALRFGWQLGEPLLGSINFTKPFLLECFFFANALSGANIARIVIGKNPASTTQGRGTEVNGKTLGAEVIVNGGNLNVRIFATDNNVESNGGSVHAYTNTSARIKIGLYNAGTGTATLLVNDVAVTTVTCPTGLATAGTRNSIHVETDNNGTANADVWWLGPSFTDLQ